MGQGSRQPTSKRKGWRNGSTMNGKPTWAMMIDKAMMNHDEWWWTAMLNRDELYIIYYTLYVILHYITSYILYIIPYYITLHHIYIYIDIGIRLSIYLFLKHILYIYNILYILCIVYIVYIFYILYQVFAGVMRRDWRGFSFDHWRSGTHLESNAGAGKASG